MPRNLHHIPRILMENTDRINAHKRSPIKTFKHWKLQVGDMVQVMEGRSTGERGKIIDVDKERNTVLIDQVNLVKKHIRSQGGQKGGIFTQSAAIHYSNVALLDPIDGEPTRVRWENRDGRRVRVSKRSNEIIPKPAKKRIYPVEGPRDTSVADTLEFTYKTPFYAKEIFALEKELREMKLLPPKEENSTEQTEHQTGDVELQAKE